PRPDELPGRHRAPGPRGSGHCGAARGAHPWWCSADRRGARGLHDGHAVRGARGVRPAPGRRGVRLAARRFTRRAGRRGRARPRRRARRRLTPDPARCIPGVGVGFVGAYATVGVAGGTLNWASSVEGVHGDVDAVAHDALDRSAPGRWGPGRRSVDCGRADRSGADPVTSTIDQAVATDTPEQAEFRARRREFLAAHAQPKREDSPWALTFHTDAEGARRAFETGRAWQRTRFDAGMTGFTYPKELGGQGGEPWHERIYEEEAA